MPTPILEDPVRRDALLQLDGFSPNKIALLFQANDLQQLARELWDKLSHVEADYEQMLASQVAEGADFRQRAMRALFEIEQTLGKALGYPWYKNDQKNFPGATTADGVCVGENVPECLADDAAHRLLQQAAQIATLQRTLELSQNNVELQQQRFEREWERAQGLQGALNLNCETAIKLGAMLEAALHERDALQAELARYRKE